MNNPPAFPIVVDYGDGVKYQNGMTLRDYFAAKAMQAWESRSDRDEMPDDLKAKQCYKIADAMLAAREEA
jgi:hypothetical protein